MMRAIKNHRVPVYIAFLFSLLAGAVYAQDAATNKLNGITLRGQVVASASVKVQNSGATDFAVWATTELNVQAGDVVVASITRRESPSTATGKEPTVTGGNPAHPAGYPKIKIKTKSSAECVVAEGKKAFLATENAPLLYASTAGANVMLTLEVLRDSTPAPSKQQTSKKKHSRN